MARLTEHLVQPPGAEYHPGPRPDSFDGLGVLAPNSRAQQRRAAAVVLDRLGDDSAVRDVLAALFQPPRRVGMRTADRTPKQVKRLDYIARVRAWCEQNEVPTGNDGRLSRTAEARYAVATGDVWRWTAYETAAAAQPATTPETATPAAPKPWIGDTLPARALRAIIREWGRGEGLPVHHNGSLNPRLVEAYYAAHPEEAS